MLRYGSAHIEVALDIDNGRRFDTYLRNVIVEGLNEALLEASAATMQISHWNALIKLHVLGQI